MNATAIWLLFLGFVAFVVFRLWSRGITRKAGTSGDARLKRIQTASWWILFLTVFSFLMGVYWMLAFLFGWPFFFQGKLRLAISHNHIYTSPAEMPQTILAWWLVKMGLSFFCYGVMFSLFRLYEKGILFSTKNVRHIRWLAYCLVVNWAVDYQLQSTLHDMALSTTPLFVGLLIIFIAWIMDEGRKIQEEQALTV